MAKFEIKEDNSGKYRFNLKAGNGQVILASQGYASMDSCKNGVESVIKHGTDDSYYERNEAKDGSYYFNLKASNGQIIGSSEMYTTKVACENGVESVKKNSQGAEVVVL